MSDKLNLVVQFTAMDGLSGPLKSMIGLGKSGSEALRAIAGEGKKARSELGTMEKDLKQLNTQLIEVKDRMAAGGLNSGLVLAERELKIAIAEANTKIAQQNKLIEANAAAQKRAAAVNAITARTAKIEAQANAYKSAGMHGLMGAALYAAPVMAMAHAAGEFQAMQNQLTMLGLDGKAVKGLTDYSQAMGIAGSSAKDNMRYLVEAQGAFRESGEHSFEEQLRGAKTMAPLMAKMAATMKASGHEMAEDQERYFLRFVEQAGGTTDPRRAAALTDGLFRALQSSGGTVDAAAYQGFLARAGTAGMKLSARSMFADFEPLIAELHDSAGVGLQGVYSRMNGMVKNQPAAREMLRLGLWNKDAVIFNKVGGIKDFKNGANPLDKGAAATLSTDPVEFYRKYVLPAYKKRGVTDIERENFLLFGRTGSTLFNLINKQLPTILRSRDAFQKTQSLDQAYNTTKDSFFGQGGQLKAAAQDFLVAAGSKGGLLENMTGMLKSATGAVRALTGAGNAHPKAFRWITTAVTWLIGMRLATASVKLVFGGLLGPVAQAWGLFSKYRALGSLAALFPRIGGGAALVGRSFGLLSRGWAVLNDVAIMGLIRAVPLVSRSLALGRVAVLLFARGIMAAGAMMWANPIVLLITAIAVAIGVLVYLVYRNWGRINAAFMHGSATVRRSLTVMAGFMKNAGVMMMNGLLMALNPSLLVTRLLDVAKRGVTAFKNYFGIKSPSRLMMEMGGHIATGLGHGMDAQGHHPVRSMRRMAAAVAGASALALAPSAHARAPSAMRGGNTYEIHVHVGAGADGETIAHAIKDAIARIDRQKMHSSYEDEM